MAYLIAFIIMACVMGPATALAAIAITVLIIAPLVRAVDRK